MKRRLAEVYEAAKDGGREGYPYIDYCNTPISAQVAGEYAVEVTKYEGGGETAVFDVRNITPNAFLDRVAYWVVTGEMQQSESPTDPLEW